MQSFFGIESNQFRNRTIGAGTIEREEFKLGFKDELVQADRRCQKREKGTPERGHSKKNLCKRENAHYLRWVGNMSASLEHGLEGHEWSWMKRLHAEDLGHWLIDIQNYVRVHYQCLKVYLSLFPLSHLFIRLNNLFPWKTGKTPCEKPHTQKKICEISEAIYLGYAWELICTKYNVCLLWDLSLSELVSLWLKGSMYARMMGFLGVGGWPQEWCSQRKSAGVGGRGKGREDMKRLWAKALETGLILQSRSAISSLCDLKQITYSLIWDSSSIKLW